MTMNRYVALLTAVVVFVTLVLLLNGERMIMTPRRMSTHNVRFPSTRDKSIDLTPTLKMESLMGATKERPSMHEFMNVGLEDWPDLVDLIGYSGDSVKQDVQFMLDFAIIGHPKTATTFTMHWLSSHKEIEMYNHELYSLQRNNPAELVSLMYQFPPGRHFKRGYKAPNDIENHHALNAIAKYWPETKLIIGLRHPVRWFESFYNFRVRHNFNMPPAETLIGPLRDEYHGVCTDEARFHHNLDNLGKTDGTTSLEKNLLGSRKRPSSIPKQMTNPVFLYEIGQLYDSNQTRADLYRSDLKEYLGLEEDLAPIASRSSSKSKDAAIDICDDKFSPLRMVLMKHSVDASTWIRNFFLEAPGVIVSSRYHFEDLLDAWLTDPCEES